MARVDLINVCKTLTERDRAGSGPVAMPEGGPTRAGGGRGAAFSLRDLNLMVADGQTVVVLGPSGCGKTTLLRIVAGLIVPDSGEVQYDGVDMQDVRPGDRRIGMVFQNYALYPHLKARTNVLSYFLFRKKTPELDAIARAKYQRTSELMGVELERLLDRRPPTLSGGEKQRVALGRCITRDAALFLVDEPFSNLDQTLRERYRVNLKTLLRQFAITTVYVTHDHTEAMILGDRLAIMDRGRIEQVGTFQEIYERPKNAFVAGFLNPHVGAPAIGFVDGARLPGARAAARERIGVRPDDVEVSRAERADGVPGTVTDALRLPVKNATLLTVRVGDDEVHAQVPGGDTPTAGAAVWLAFARYHVFDRDSGARLRSHPEA